MAEDCIYKKELGLLGEYMKVYIQLLPACIQCGGSRIHRQQLPTFEYFKSTRDDERYSLVIPHYKESKTVCGNGQIRPVHTHGLRSDSGIAFRYYNFWMGCKYYTEGNIEGDYTLMTGEINDILKAL